MFQLSDVYIMPSVSEPFGISPLEAMRSGTCRVISRSRRCGRGADYMPSKVDYRDVDAMADAIYGFVKYPPCRKMLAKKGLSRR